MSIAMEISAAIAKAQKAIVEGNDSELVTAATEIVEKAKTSNGRIIDRSFVEPLSFIADQLVPEIDPSLAVTAYIIAHENAKYHDQTHYDSTRDRYCNNGKYYFLKGLRPHILASIAKHAPAMPDVWARVEALAYVANNTSDRQLKEQVLAGIAGCAEDLSDASKIVEAFTFVSRSTNDDQLKMQALAGIARHAPQLSDPAACIKSFIYICENTRDENLRQIASDGIEKRAPELPTPLGRVEAYEVVAVGKGYPFYGTKDKAQKKRAMDGMLKDAEGLLPDHDKCMRVYMLVAEKSEDVGQKQQAVAGIMKYKNSILTVSGRNKAFKVASQNVCANTDLQKLVESEREKHCEAFFPKPQVVPSEPQVKCFANLWGLLPKRTNG